MPGIEGLTAVSVALRAMEMLEDLILTLRTMHQPVIAAVNGAAIGGGLCLALACDIRGPPRRRTSARPGSTTASPPSELGLSHLLPRPVGSSRAAEWMLTGRDIDADEAALTGLVSRVVPDDELIESCLETASAITPMEPPGRRAHET